jgi:ATP-dependent DNA helicase PIF1
MLSRKLMASLDPEFLAKANKIAEGGFALSDIPGVLSPEQYWAATLTMANPGVTFVTGGAGTGKSRLLSYIAKHSMFADRVRVCAPTGTAALQVGGYTIHSLFGIQVWNGYPKLANPENPRRGGYTPTLRLRVLQALDFLIIDEISMVRADIVDTMDRALRNAKDNDLPFGGIRVLMIGDPFQLPPVQDRKWQGSIAQGKYGQGFFFQADVFRGLEVLKIRLTEIHRQKDKAFIDSLERLRLGRITKQSLDNLNTAEIIDPPPNDCLVLFPRNKEVDRYNSEKLAELDGPESSFLAKRSGSYLATTVEGKYKLSELVDPLVLKVGAQVMFMKNDDQGPPKDKDGLPKYRWTNGTLGIVTEIGKEYVRVRYSTPNGEQVERKVMRSKWEDRKPVVGFFGMAREEIVGTFEQIPLRLAWGATIHKSQGATYGKVHVDLSSGTWQAGHAYVALSRVQSLKGLSLTTPLTIREVQPLDREVLDFMRERSFECFPNRDYVEAHKNYKKLEQTRLKIEEREAKRKQIRDEKARLEKEQRENMLKEQALQDRAQKHRTLELRVAALLGNLQLPDGFGFHLSDLAIIAPLLTSKADPDWSSDVSRSERWLDVLTQMNRDTFTTFANGRLTFVHDLLKARGFELAQLHRFLSFGLPVNWNECRSFSGALRPFVSSAEASKHAELGNPVNDFELVNEFARYLHFRVTASDPKPPYQPENGKVPKTAKHRP